MFFCSKLVGLLSCVLAIIFLLTCLYYFICRRRYSDEMPDSPSSVALVNKNGVTSVPVATEMTTTNLLMKQVKKKNCFNRYNSY